MSKITKTKEAFGWIDGYLEEAKEGSVTIPALVSSASAAEWETFEANYGTGGSLIGALNAAWSEAYTVEIVTDATYEILATGSNTAYMFVNPTPGGNVLVALPAASDIGEGAVIEVVVTGTFEGEISDGMFVMSVDGTDTIAWRPGGTYTSVNMSTQQSFSKIKLMSNGTDGWGVLDAMGYWGESELAEGAWTFTAAYRFDGQIPGGVEDNAVSIDAFGNIKDSGVPVGGGGGSGLLSDVIMPVVGSPTSMNRGDEWFNLSYSASVLSGFDILAYEPDDRQDPMPLTWKISFDAGEVCLRATPDINSAVTVYSVPADEIYVTGPVAYVYAYLDGEALLIDSRSSWSRLYDRLYALIYALTIYDHKAPEIPVLESIVLGETLDPAIPPSAISSPSSPPYTVQLVATGYYVGGAFMDVTSSVESWSSSDETRATVSAGGLVTFITPGSGTTATITASIGVIEDTIIADNSSW